MFLFENLTHGFCLLDISQNEAMCRIKIKKKYANMFWLFSMIKSWLETKKLSLQIIFHKFSNNYICKKEMLDKK